MNFKDWLSVHELKMPSFWKDLLSEALVSCYLVMYVTFALVTFNEKVYAINTTHVGLMVGFLIYQLIEGYGPVSGGFMNPSTTFTRCLAGRITVVRGVFYTIVQSGGGIIGSEIVYVLTPVSMRASFQPFLPAPEITPWQGMMVELLLSFNLLYCGLGSSDSRSHKLYLPSMPPGFAIGVGIMAAGTWTGACQNPIVALGPAFISNNFQHHWIYWVGPYIAGALAASLHYLFHAARDKSKDRINIKQKEDSDVPMKNNTRL